MCGLGHRKASLCLGAILPLALAVPLRAATLLVGPTRTYKTPCAAIAAASPGDIIEIDPALYQGDVCAWTTDNLTLVGVLAPDGSRPHLDADNKNAQGKGIWIPYGANTIVENIEFSGARVPSHNGAGIRQSGVNLTVLNCYFHDNQEGILESNIPGSNIVIKFTEFARNGYKDGQSHNLYIGHAASLDFEFNYSHDAIVGHLLKSRAAVNYVLYNRLTGENGTDSYELDLPNGGTSCVIGNLIQQGPNTQNFAMLSYMEEGASSLNPGSDLYVVNNSFVNQYPAGGIFVQVGSADTTPVLLQNNIFFGPGSITTQANPTLMTNFVGDPDFVDLSTFDYHLNAGSLAIDTGSQPGVVNGFQLTPRDEYVHPACGQLRYSVGIIDIGAYEFGDGGPLLECR
jgi:hypothetical protein